MKSSIHSGEKCDNQGLLFPLVAMVKLHERNSASEFIKSTLNMCSETKNSEFKFELRTAWPSSSSGVSTDCSPTWQPTWIGRGSHLVVSGTLKRCSLHGWILVFAIQDRWQTACEALYWWPVCWSQCWPIKWPMVAVRLWYGQMCVRGYGMGRCMLWTTNAGALYWSWGPLLCHSSMTITSCCRMIMDCPQESVHNSWKLKTFQFLHGQHNYRTCHPLSMSQMLWIGVYDGTF